MIRVDLAYIYELSSKFDPLKQIQPESKLDDVWVDLYFAKLNLEDLYTNSVFATVFRASRGPAGALLVKVEELLTAQETNPTEEVGFAAYSVIQRHISEVETIVRAELSSADGYLVTPLGAYDSSTLLLRPEAAWPDELLTKVPSTLADVDAAGKCLAFHLSTAAGFHILRIVESTLQEYWKTVSGGKAPPKAKTIGAYIVHMEKNGFGDKKIIASLNQIRDLHRNPLMHPEDNLTVEDSIVLFGISVSVVSQMLRQI
tara:strand:+ start:98 stop:871 length:774 start_codon:yes stop_codon:yes gene_type:complete